MSQELVVRTVSRVAAARVVSLFGTGRKGMVRVRGFTGPEVAEMVASLETWAGEEIKLVVISATELEGVPNGYLIPSGRSATTFRNVNDACVFFEVDRFSDEQGLRNVTLLEDGTLLRSDGGRDGSRGEPGVEHNSVEACRRVLEIVWSTAGSGGGPPESVLKSAADLIDVFNDQGRRVALREWAGFAATVYDLLPRDRPVDGYVGVRAVGQALPAVKLFEDSVLPQYSGPVPRRRRLAENALAAADKSSKGREIERDELIRLVARTSFRKVDSDELLPDEEMNRVRRSLVTYLEAPQRTSTEGIEFAHWSQLFEQTSRRRGVGTRVEDEISEVAPERLEELHALDVVDQLNHKDAEAAQRLLDEEAADPEKDPISALLSTGLRKAVERIANPTARATTQPLRHLLRLFYTISDEDGSAAPLRLEVRKSHGSESQDQLSKGLFALLFGPTLQDVADETGGAFFVASDLVDSSPLASWATNQTAESDEEKDDEGQWDPLRLQLRWEDEEEAIDYFEWRPRESPGYALIAVLLHQSRVWQWESPNSDFDDWVAKLLQGEVLPTEAVQPAAHALTKEWLGQRSSVFRELADNGLRADLLSDYVSLWETLLDRVYRDHVPQGVSEPEVAEFLAVDVHRGQSAAPTVLATHPVRLRWIARHLDELRQKLTEARLGKLRLNEVNERLFFDSCAQASPHEQPPVYCDDARVYVAVRETCWHERFELVRTRETTVADWLSDLDDSSLDEIAGALGKYVDAFPYKADGLHLLIVAREGSARMIREVLRRFLSQTGLTGRRGQMRMVLHVVCPPAEYGAVSDAISGFDDGSDRAEADFPRIRVLFHEWSSHDAVPMLESISNIDVAVVPNLFSAATRCQEATRSIDDHPGRFDPWLDAPTAREQSTDGAAAKNVSRLLVPEQRDTTLAKWSTINVRHFRGAVVGGPAGGDELDVVRLSVSVAEGEAFFGAIHDIAHWVVTLDAFVGRRQIEALEHRPEVITVKPGLGKGGTYTLVVSSQVGRDFVVHRLARRIEQQLGRQLIAIPAKTIAEQIYDRAREVAPGTLLRALGLGRTAQELVGLIVSQRLVQQFRPSPRALNYFESWIALDERPEWFIGGRASRADLLRIWGGEVDGNVTLFVTIVEAKLQDQSAVRKAEQQLDLTATLFEQALRPRDQDPCHDVGFWRREILKAIEESAREPKEGGGWSFVAEMDGRREFHLGRRLREALRQGDYTLMGVEGVVCTVSARREESRTPSGRHIWLQVTPQEVADVLRAIGDREEPVDSRHDPALTVDSGTAQLENEVSGTPSEQHALPREPGQVTSSRRGLSEQDLLNKYQLVLDTFAEYDIEVLQDREEPVQEGPGFFVFRVIPGSGVQPAKVMGQAENLKYRLRLPAELNPRAYIDRGAVVFEVPKSEDERYYVDAGELWSTLTWPTDRLWVAIGEDVRGRAVTIDFSSSDTPHLLIGGITGAGKSVALETVLRGMLAHYTADQLQIAAVDPKGTELSFLEDYPQVANHVGYTPHDAIALLDNAVSEMNRRYELMRGSRVRSLNEWNALVGEDTFPWQVVVLDEFADLTSDRDARKDIESALQRLAQKARAAGIHVIVATQKPSAEVISTTVRSNLGAQLALRVKTATDSRIVMDAPGAEALAGNGDALLKAAGGSTVRLQCARVAPRVTGGNVPV
jgi:DNA segregation ATPase FtsK/SpoIIIE, S-DNA-T family